MGLKQRLPSVRFGTLTQDTGLSFADAWCIAARHLVRTGLARQAEAALRCGMTVRALPRALYGVKAGPEWDAAAERRAFLRTIRQANANEQKSVRGNHFFNS